MARARPAPAPSPASASAPIVAPEPDAPAAAEPAPLTWPARCRVVGPGSVIADGRVHSPGAEVILGERDALDFGALVERID